MKENNIIEKYVKYIKEINKREKINEAKDKRETVIKLIEDMAKGLIDEMKYARKTPDHNLTNTMKNVSDHCKYIMSKTLKL